MKRSLLPYIVAAIAATTLLTFCTKPDTKVTYGQGVPRSK